jgi:predicted DsbA family dithiol-disulfide isomerase
MHASLFAQPTTKSDSDLIAQAKNIGLDMGQFGTCLSGGKHAAAVKDSVARMEQLGIGGTPMTLIGLTPAPGQPMKVVKYIYGAKPYSEFKAAIDSLLQPQ